MRSRALVLEAPRRLSQRHFDLPEIGDDDGLLRVEACGLCGTDHEEFTGELFPGYAFVPGHESVGIIEQIGPGAAARGTCTRATASRSRCSCRAASATRAGRARIDAARATASPTCTDTCRVDRAPGLWGGYAEYQYLAPDSLLCPVPDVARLR